MSDLEALAARVEALSGPDRDVDGIIDRLMFARPKDGEYCEKENAIWRVDDGWSGLLVRAGMARDSFCASRYTASLDAAMTLIVGPPEYPNHKTFLIDCATQTSVYGQPVAYVWSDAGKHMGKGSSPSLALCAAALRARAHSTPIPEVSDNDE